MSYARIGLIGAGQIGTRHLEALSLFRQPLEIEVIDPSAQALEKAKQQWTASTRGFSPHKVTCFQQMTSSSTEYDLVIVATTARQRRQVVEELLATKRLPYLILEKVLFQHPDDLQDVAELLERKKVRCWVNCPLRTQPLFKLLKTKLKKLGGPFIYSISGSKWGLACNSIHHLDTISFISGDFDWSLDTSHLDKGWLPSKRPGFIEFSGTLLGQNKGGCLAQFTSFSTGEAPFSIYISAPHLRCMVVPKKKSVWIAEAERGWRWRRTPFQLPLQSRLTHLLVQQILNQGESELPSYLESSRLHHPLLSSFLHHLQQMDGGIDRCPIT